MCPDMGHFCRALWTLGEKTLPKSCWNSGDFFSLKFLQQPLIVRVDPAAVCEEKTPKPMEIAAEGEKDELLQLLAEFTEMPDHIKLYRLSKLMYKGEEKSNEEFQKTLSSLSVKLVSVQSIGMLCFIR